MLKLKEGYRIDIGAASFNGMSFRVVNIYHPNMGWGPWFFLWKLNSEGDKPLWHFVPLSNVTESWAKKQLRTLRKLKDWINQSKKK
jgi:hypothetical protein